MREQHLYIPPDVGVATTGVITTNDWPKVYRFGNRPDRALLSFTGMGMPVITYITQSGPDQPGETILKFVLEPRFVQYMHARIGDCGRQSYWDNRQNIGSLLSPGRQSATAINFELGRLRVVLPNGDKRDIDATIQSGPIFTARNPTVWNEYNFIEALRFRCPDPTWYDPERVDVVWGIEIYEGLIFYEVASYPDHLTFPDNMIFGTDIVTASTAITYTGTWFGYPIIYITGPIAAPVVENVTLNQKIALSYNISVGETVTIDTTYGRKAITNNFGDNLIGTQTNDSSLEFWLGHDPHAPGGVNSLQCSGSGANADTEIRLGCFTRYIMI